ncbi:hypothetical protein BC830DRAFT_598459 [Chytriomyces sp. MP71]|nr:hypothetical protein BC830DRAFT_598459 [Chytriomyces sp. MP71]
MIAPLPPAIGGLDTLPLRDTSRSPSLDAESLAPSIPDEGPLSPLSPALADTDVDSDVAMVIAEFKSGAAAALAAKRKRTNTGAGAEESLLPPALGAGPTSAASAEPASLEIPEAKKRFNGAAGEDTDSPVALPTYYNHPHNHPHPHPHNYNSLSSAPVKVPDLLQKKRLGSRLLAHSHSQLASLILQLVEKRAICERNLVELLPNRCDLVEIEGEIQESLTLLTKLLAAAATGATKPASKVVCNNPHHAAAFAASASDAVWFKRCSPLLARIKTLIFKHSAHLLDAGLHADYITFFAPLALRVADALPVWDDPKNNKLPQAIWKKVATGLRIAVPRVKINLAGVCALAVTATATTTTLAATVAASISLSNRPVNGGSDGGVGEKDAGKRDPVQGLVSKEDLLALVRAVKSCRGFEGEIGQFSPVLDAVDAILDV